MGYEVTSIACIFSDFKILVVHPLLLRHYTIKDHFDATSSIKKIVYSKDYEANTIIGGDFNEPTIMLYSFRRKTREKLHFRTGTILNPTWRHNGSTLTPVRANIDQIHWTKKGTLKLKNFEVINSKLSDHKPLYTEFIIGAIAIS